MRRHVLLWLIFVLLLCALLAASLANAFIVNVGFLMQPGGGTPSGPPEPQSAITTEAGAFLTTEGGNILRTEQDL